MSPPAAARARILFVAEAVTLAHVARPVTLARSLESGEFEVHLAQHPRYRSLLGDIGFREHTIASIAPQQFTQALAVGSPLYDLQTLIRYVEEDLSLLATVKPDIVVGDFRLSLSVSARLSGVPYVALGNAYWSPYCRQAYTVPDLPLTRMLGPTLAQAAFSVVRPGAFAWHCVPMWRLRRRYGLASLGFDLRRVYTDADYTLYADAPVLYHTHDMPPRHRFIGPVDWSPALPLPAWWETVPKGKPLVYVTLGSSGHAALLPELIAALGCLDVTALVATAGVPAPPGVPPNVFIADYLPGDACVARASLVICNGGSPATYQSLLRGVPVLGVATNLDQFLNMAVVEATGAGSLLRAGTARASQMVARISALLADTTAGEAARRLTARLAQYDPVEVFPRILREVRAGAT